MSDHPKGELELRIRARFTQACHNLDGATRQELRKRRESALASAKKVRHGWQPLAPAGALATIVAIAGVVWLSPERIPKPPSISAEAAQEAADETAHVLDDDPDFYMWLATEPAASDNYDTQSAAVQESDR